MRGEIIKKFLVFFLVLLVGIYFGVGWFAYGQAASVPCDVWYEEANNTCLLYTSPSPRDLSTSRMPSSA